MRLLLTGGTGTFGHAFLRYSTLPWDRIYIYSRDEQKQYAMRQLDLPNVRCIMGDVRDEAKLRQVMRRCDVVVHAAANKIVPSGAWNPDEMILTNVIGTMNVIRAAVEAGVKKVVVLSTDKCVESTTLYGATKFCQEQLALQANNYASPETAISVVRYGNVLGSRGSFSNIVDECVERGNPIPITDLEMTRFWISQHAAAMFVDQVITNMDGGEIWVPKLPSTKITDLVPVGHPVTVVGMRPTEKLHETLVAEFELPWTDEFREHFVIHYHPYQGNTTRVEPYRSDSYEALGLHPDEGAEPSLAGEIQGEHFTTSGEAPDDAGDDLSPPE